MIFVILGLEYKSSFDKKLSMCDVFPQAVGPEITKMNGCFKLSSLYVWDITSFGLIVFSSIILIQNHKLNLNYILEYQRS